MQLIKKKKDNVDAIVFSNQQYKTGDEIKVEDEDNALEYLIESML